MYNFVAQLVPSYIARLKHKIVKCMEKSCMKDICQTKLNIHNLNNLILAIEL